MTTLSWTLLAVLTAALAVILVLARRLGRLSRALKREVEGLSEKLADKTGQAGEDKKRVLAILESMSEGVAVIDPEQRIMLVNSVFARLFERSRKELAGRFFWEVVRDPETNELIRRVTQERRPESRERSAPLSDSVFHVQASPVFGQDRGSFLGVVAVFHDVTKLKELERHQREFVANVSHELKTPLTSILGFVETLKSGAGEDAADRARFLDIIDQQSQRLNRLIEDLLLLSKIPSDQALPPAESFRLDELLAHLESSFEKALKARSLKLWVEMSPKPYMIRSDRGLVEEALSNLIDNAIKYNVQGGRIAVTAARENGGHRLTVTDTGIGIPPADLPRVFERFYRADKSRSRQLGGTGLGLAITKHILERLGGTIEVQSTLQKGSTFSLFIPEATS